MSLLKAIKAQLGLSNTPANNFTLDASADNGTLKLARGNAGATTQDLITVSASNVVTGGSGAVLVGNGPAFSAARTSNQTGGASGVATKVQLNVENFDTAGAYDSTTNYRFQPNVAGYYQISFGASLSGAGLSYATVQLYKNGTFFRSGSSVQSGGDVVSVGSAVMFLNGTTDYLELFSLALVSSGNVTILGTGANSTYMDGYLVRAV